jgi:hypothetical protein
MVKLLKTLGILIVVATFAGCATTKDIKLTTTTVPVAVPLLYSPAPPDITRPDLPHLHMTPADEKIDGKVVQAYAASIQALLGYTTQLETIVAQYKDINQSYAGLRQKLIEDWKTKTGTDISVPETPALSTLPTTPTKTPTTSAKPVVPSVGDLAR